MTILIMNQQVQVIKLSGSFNANSSQEFQKKIARIIESKAQIVLINCHDVTFMDSSGLGALVLAFKMLREVGIKMVLCSINQQVRILFELTSMDNVFEIFPSQDQFNNTLLLANAN